MSKKSARWASLLDFAIDRTSEKPIYRQIYDIIIKAVLDGRIRPGSPLPSTRSLATTLGVSRTSVVEAFDLLAAEGYVETRHGSGTYVTELNELHLVSPSLSPPLSTDDLDFGNIQDHVTKLAAIGRAAIKNSEMTKPFAVGLCTLDSRTRDAWRRLSVKHSNSISGQHHGYFSPLGNLRLREEISKYLSAYRGVICDASQIMVVSGTQQAMDIVIRTLLSSSSKVWIEDPAYPSSRAVLEESRIKCFPVQVDGNGLVVKKGLELAPDAECAFVTPSHQFATGAVMSIKRRLELLNWAESNGSWIIEDDYDSEYRFAGRPIAALQGLNKTGRVIYIGTFSKVLFPGLRLGYLVMPPALVEAFSGIRSLLDRHPPTIQQDILADFLAEGFFLSHIRRNRSYYQEALKLTVEELRSEIGSTLKIRTPDAGMQLVIELPRQISDVKLCKELTDSGIASRPLSPLYQADANRKSAIVLGFTGFSHQELRKSARSAGKIVREYIIRQTVAATDENK